MSDENGNDSLQVEEILKKRAELYAQKRTIIDEKVLLRKVAVFSMDGELYGIEVDEIKEVFHLDNFTPLPATPDFLKGVVNVRGIIMPVIDLKAFFQLSDSGISDLNKVIILGNEEYELGLLADSIREVIEIDLNKLEPPLPVLTDVRADYTKGLINGIIVLDATRIVNDKKLIIDDK